jgi:Coiled coil protein 84
MTDRAEHIEPKLRTLVRCDLCRRSHSKGKTHVYSISHVENVKKALSKFGLKVSFVTCTDTVAFISVYKTCFRIYFDICDLIVNS